ncbi:MAG: hypothetical protein EON61_26345 [Alphaproteobacteria bacterium]|jgi:hypothetical protein|nr:MAG: hypothetical protein EON61_26345 [Alphaproteobacteria bacterium]
MALKIIEGAVDAVGTATALPDGGTSWDSVRFSRGRKKPVTLGNVMADPKVGARIAVGQMGRFAFYAHTDKFILCGFSGSHGIEIVGLEDDPAAIAAAAIRTPAKRKVLLGFMMIPTIIGLFFGPGMIKAGYAVLRANPPPHRPGNKRLTRALKGELYWPF